jgi:hypothetical protein
MQLQEEKTALQFPELQMEKVRLFVSLFVSSLHLVCKLMHYRIFFLCS